MKHLDLTGLQEMGRLFKAGLAGKADIVHGHTADAVTMAADDPTTVAEEIADLKNSSADVRDALAASISEKGVTVPEGATLASMAGLVDQIPAGYTIQGIRQEYIYYDSSSSAGEHQITLSENEILVSLACVSGDFYEDRLTALYFDFSSAKVGNSVSKGSVKWVVSFGSEGPIYPTFDGEKSVNSQSAILNLTQSGLVHLAGGHSMHCIATIATIS